MAITYSKELSRVNWVQLVDDLEIDDFHNGPTSEELQRSFENSAVVVLALDESDRIVGTVRVLSDGVCNAYVVDVWTRTDYRRQGVASHMMTLIEEDLSGQHIYLFTDDSMAFYESLGYRPQGTGLAKVVGSWLNRYELQ